MKLFWVMISKLWPFDWINLLTYWDIQLMMWFSDFPNTDFFNFSSKGPTSDAWQGEFINTFMAIISYWSINSNCRSLTEEDIKVTSINRHRLLLLNCCLSVIVAMQGCQVWHHIRDSVDPRLRGGPRASWSSTRTSTISRGSPCEFTNTDYSFNEWTSCWWERWVKRQRCRLVKVTIFQTQDNFTTINYWIYDLVLIFLVGILITNFFYIGK